MFDVKNIMYPSAAEEIAGNQNNRWLTPPDSEVMKMIGDIYEISEEDKALVAAAEKKNEMYNQNKGLNIARSVIDQQKSYEAYQKAMKDAGVTKENQGTNKGYQTYAQWLLGNKFVTAPSNNPPEKPAKKEFKYDISKKTDDQLAGGFSTALLLSDDHDISIVKEIMKEIGDMYGVSKQLNIIKLANKKLDAHLASLDYTGLMNIYQHTKSGQVKQKIEKKFAGLDPATPVVAKPATLATPAASATPAAPAAPAATPAAPAAEAEVELSAKERKEIGDTFNRMASAGNNGNVDLVKELLPRDSGKFTKIKTHLRTEVTNALSKPGSKKDAIKQRYNWIFSPEYNNITEIEEMRELISKILGIPYTRSQPKKADEIAQGLNMVLTEPGKETWRVALEITGVE